jgi:hypothetical protein
MCVAGAYQVTGDCVFEEAAEMENRATTLQIATATVDFVGTRREELDWAAWGLAHYADIVQAAAIVLNISESLIRIEFVDDNLAASVLLSVQFMAIIDQGGLPEDVSPSDSSSLQQWLEKLSGGSARRLGERALSVAQTGVLGQIIAILETDEVTVPSDLYTAQGEMPESVEIVDNVYMSLPQWIVTPWSECPSTCGEGTAFRNVTCSAGSVAQCQTGFGLNTAGEEPAGSKPCEDYTGCPFDVMCPAGRSEDGECATAKNAAVLATVVSLALLCVTSLCCGLRRCLRPPMNAEGKQADFKADKTVSTSFGIDDLETGEARAVWDINFENGAASEEEVAAGVSNETQVGESPPLDKGAPPVDESLDEDVFSV